MITKQEIFDSIRHETKIIKHLASKLEPKHLDYKPTQNQRSMSELLQYLTFCALTPMLNIVTGNWEHAEEIAKKSANVNLENFAEAMDRQVKEVENEINKFTEEELATKDATLPWGTPIKAGIALVEMVVKTYSVYRMQLFLYAKSAGLTELDSFDCWIGTDKPKN